MKKIEDFNLKWGEALSSGLGFKNLGGGFTGFPGWNGGLFFRTLARTYFDAVAVLLKNQSPGILIYIDLTSYTRIRGWEVDFILPAPEILSKKAKNEKISSFPELI